MGRAKEWVVQQKNLLQRIGAVALALALWQLLAMAVGQQLLVPTPLSVLQRLGTIWREDGFWSTIWFTFRKIVVGFLLGLGFGLGFGALAGRFPLFEILFRPWAVMIKSIPVASFIIICLIWMSSARLSIFISFLMVLPIIYSNVLQSIHSVDRQMLEAVKVFRLSWPKRVLYLWLPQLRLRGKFGDLLEGRDRRRDHRDSRRVHWPNVLRRQGLLQHRGPVCPDGDCGGDQRSV